MVGYYIDEDGGCSSCPASCISCFSEAVCYACELGYTLADGFTEGQCIECASPCLTCRGSSNYCTTCIDGYRKDGWKCQSIKNIGFNINLNTQDLANVLSTIDIIIEEMLTILNISTSNVDAITFSSIKAGSIDLTGTVTPPDTS